MCGIFGCIIIGGNAAPVIKAALSRLEYRGYDSVGEATIFEGKLYLKKDAGKIEDIHQRINLNDLPGNIGIGHTRWATHGAPTMVNAHPHTDCSSMIAVVHNGIIENFSELRNELEKTGHKFKSRTDSEVLPHLLEENLEEGVSLREAVHKVLKKIRGSYAIAVLSTKDPDKIICACNESPLVIGIGDDAVYCASDITAFLPLTNRVLFVEENEIVTLGAGYVDIFDSETGESKVRNVTIVDWTPETSEKTGFSHFMVKEINDQPLALKNALRTQELYFDLIANSLIKAKKIYLVACGTSYHACLAASYMFSQLAHLEPYPSIGSEFIQQHGDSIDSESVVLAVSQSGETADTLNAVRYAKEKGSEIIGITNVMGSTLTRLSGVYVGQNSGPEISVAATKTFTSQVIILAKIAMTLAEKSGTISPFEIINLENKLVEIPYVVKSIIESTDEKIKALAVKYKDASSFCFLGRGINSATAMEGMLKLLEVAYTPSLAYPAGESKHGFIALIEDNYPVMFVAPKDNTHSKIIGNIMEMNARGADTIVVIEEGDCQIKEVANEVIEIPRDIPSVLTPTTFIIPLQLFAHYMALEKGYDPDKPRNLAKSVTVE